MRLGKILPMSVIRKIYNVADKYLVYGLFIFIASFYLIPLGKINNNIFYAIVLLPGLIILYFDWRKIIIAPPLMAILLLFGYTAFSTVWSEGDGLLELTKEIKHVLYIVVLMLMISRELAYKNRDMSLFIDGLVVVGVVSATINALLWYQDHSISHRLWGKTGIWECIGLGVSYALMATLALYQTFQAKRTSKKIFMFLCCVLLIIAVLLTQSRLALGCLIGSVAVIIFGFNTKKAWLLLLIIASLGGLVLFIEPSLLGRHLRLVREVFDGGAALPARFYIWENLMSKMDGVWLFGHGMGESLDNNVPRLPGQTYETAHSVYIGQVYLTGIIGFVLLLNFIFQAGRSALQQMESEKKVVMLSLVVFACLCMLGQYTLLLDHPTETWINILIPFSMAYGSSLWFAEGGRSKS